MAAGSANPKRKKISLSLMHSEAHCEEWGVRVHRHVHSSAHPSFMFLDWNLDCSSFLVGLMAFSLSLSPCLFKMRM